MAEPTLLPERLQYRPTKIELDESIEKAKATLLKKIKRSVYVYRVDCGGCNGCEIEIFGSITPVFDVERFGIKVVPSPRHADVLLYTGAVTRAMRMPALRAFEAAPDPKIVVSYGACGCTGGIFYDNYCVWGGTDKILPVDVYIPGCPPSPAQTIYGFAWRSVCWTKSSMPRPRWRPPASRPISCTPACRTSCVLPLSARLAP